MVRPGYDLSENVIEFAFSTDLINRLPLDGSTAQKSSLSSIVRRVLASLLQRTGSSIVSVSESLCNA